MTIILQERNTFGVIENFLSEEDFSALYEKLNSENFLWSFRVGLANQSDEKPAFSRLIYAAYEKRVESELFESFMPIIKKMNPYALLRMKLNLSVKTEKNEPCDWHTDMPECVTMVMFFDDTNGHFEIENMGKFECKKNTAVIFDSNLMHRGFSCTDNPKRIVLNINYIQSPEEIME